MEDSTEYIRCRDTCTSIIANYRLRLICGGLPAASLTPPGSSDKFASRGLHLLVCNLRTLLFFFLTLPFSLSTPEAIYLSRHIPSFTSISFDRPNGLVQICYKSRVKKKTTRTVPSREQNPNEDLNSPCCARVNKQTESQAKKKSKRIREKKKKSNNKKK